MRENLLILRILRRGLDNKDRRTRPRNALRLTLRFRNHAARRSGGSGNGGGDHDASLFLPADVANDRHEISLLYDENLAAPTLALLRTRLAIGSGFGAIGNFRVQYKFAP
jgi:hypothetical protein